jgi:predicted transport protein
MTKLTRFTIQKIQIQMRRIAFEGAGLSILLTLVLLVLASNIIRVIQDGQDNYNIYKSEQESLLNIKLRNEGLVRELNIVSSDEYQKLLARDVLGIGEIGENLYRLEDSREFFKVEKKYIDLAENKDYERWWAALLDL